MAATSLSASEIIIKQDFDKVINKEFPISQNGTFDVSNKYGSINITEWEKNAVDIKVIISVKASSQSKADDVFNRIKINFSNDAGYVSAKTEIESGSSSWFSWGSDSDFQINYEVKMPKSLHLKLSNKYGNAYFPNLSNGAEITIGYGDLKMRSIKGETKLDLSYGNASFENLDAFNVEMKYSNLNGEKTQDLRIDSKYSKIVVNNANDIKSTTKYDTYRLGVIHDFSNEGGYDNFTIKEANNLTISSKYTDLNVENLKGNLKSDLKFGHININKLTCNNGSVEFNTSYVEVEIGMDGCMNYDIEFEGNYTDFDSSRSMKTNSNKDGHQSTIKAKNGTGGRKMIFDMSYGRLKFN